MTPRRLGALAVAVALTATSLTGLSVDSATAAATSPDDPVDQILAISVDGLNPRAIEQLGAKGTPAFHRMMSQGVWTLNARTSVEQTRTLPNHTSMLTGRRIDPAHGGHGVTFNVDDGGTVHRAAGHYVASVFDVVHDNGGSTALYSAKTKFAFYQRSWNTAGAADRTGRDNGRAKIDKVVLDTDNARLVAGLRSELSRSPRTFTFLHISLPDVAGHADGFMGPEYLAAVRETDRLLGTLLATIAARPALRQHLMVVLTADHGGSGSSHSDPASGQNYAVPFFAWGPGVAAGTNIYTINPGSFRSASGRRPGYTGVQPVRNGDVANLTTDLLDLPAVPGAELDRPRTLNLFPL